MAEIKVAGAITQIGSTASDFQQPGAFRRETDGKSYRLCKAGVSLGTDGASCMLQLDSVSGTDGYTVESMVASTTPLFGINATGATVAAGEYFWAQVGGPITITSNYTTNVALAVNAGVYMQANFRMSSAVAGHLCGISPAAIATNATGVVILDCIGGNR
jgi:hypothetical protein